MATKGERGVCGMNGEVGIDIYTILILYIKHIASTNILYSTGNSPQCSVMDGMGRKSKKKKTTTRIYV